MYALRIIIETIHPPVDPEKPWNGHKSELYSQMLHVADETVDARIQKIIKAANDL